MAKTSTVTIKALEKQCSALEEKIIKAKNKKIAQLEKFITKNKSDIKKTKAKLTTEKTKLLLAKTPAKKKASKAKQIALKKMIADQTVELKVLKAALADAKNEYKNAVALQKVKLAAAKEAAKPKRKKRVLGPKIKTKKVSQNTVVPATFLAIDTDTPVEPAPPTTEHNTIATNEPPATPIETSNIEPASASASEIPPLVRTDNLPAEETVEKPTPTDNKPLLSDDDK